MRYSPDQSALDIANTLLEQTGDAAMSGDFDGFRAAFHLPHLVSTFEGEKTYETDADLRHVFDMLRSQLMQLNVTDMARRIVSAAFVTPQQIASTHVTNLMSGQTRVKDAYPVFSILKVVDDRWQIMSSDYALEPDSGLERTVLNKK